MNKSVSNASSSLFFWRSILEFEVINLFLNIVSVFTRIQVVKGFPPQSFDEVHHFLCQSRSKTMVGWVRDIFQWIFRCIFQWIFRCKFIHFWVGNASDDMFLGWNFPKRAQPFRSKIYCSVLLVHWALYQENFKYSCLNNFLSWWNYSQLRFNWTKNTIYIYSHPQTDCFVLSELFSVARHVGLSKPGSKPIQLYVRLSIRAARPTSVPRLAKGIVKVSM